MPVTLPDTAPLLAWYPEHARKLPWRETKDPYRIWVSEIMLQQTRVEAVLPYYRRFLDTLPDVAALAVAPEPLLLKLWEGLGYYSRVRHMQKAAKTIMAVHGGVFPNDYNAVRALAGVGDYTAGAICSFAFDLPVPAVDGNVLRVAARLAAYDGDVLSPAAKKELTTAVAAAQPADAPALFNQAMMELGATVCLPNGTPKCELCPLAHVCLAHAKGLETALPVRRRPAPRKIEERTVLLLHAGDRVALCRRPETGLLAGLFEPYCLAGRLSAAEVTAHLAAFGVTPLRVAPLGEAKHVFTHLEWHMVGYDVEIPPEQCENLPDHLFFTDRAEVDRRVALPGAYRAYRAFL